MRFVSATIGQLTGLKELDLSSNPIRTLPDAIGQLTNLNALWLAENPLFILYEQSAAVQAWLQALEDSGVTA